MCDAAVFMSSRYGADDDSAFAVRLWCTVDEAVDAVPNAALG